MRAVTRFKTLHLESALPPVLSPRQTATGWGVPEVNPALRRVYSMTKGSY